MERDIDRSGIDQAIRLYSNLIEEVNIRSKIAKQYFHKINLEFCSLNDPLGWIVKQWKDGRKICRPLKVFPVFKMITGRELPDSLKLLMLSLDAKINFLDEFIDNSRIDKKEKVDMAIANVFNDLNVILGFFAKN